MTDGDPAIRRARIDPVVFQAGGQHVLLQNIHEHILIRHFGPGGAMGGILYQANRRFARSGGGNPPGCRP